MKARTVEFKIPGDFSKPIHVVSKCGKFSISRRSGTGKFWAEEIETETDTSSTGSDSFEEAVASVQQYLQRKVDRDWSILKVNLDPKYIKTIENGIEK